MEDGLLSLKWNNHKSTFFHILSGLRKKETYTDATLACEGKFFPVHRLVMSTCSDYFGEVFERTTCKSPVVILKDIRYHDLEALLDYMYLGEVDVKQSELAGLIKAAECLRIKGLAVPDEDPTHAPVNKKGATHVPESRNRGAYSPAAKRARRASGGSDGGLGDSYTSSNSHHRTSGMGASKAVGRRSLSPTASPSRAYSSSSNVTSTSVPSQATSNSDTLHNQIPPRLMIPPPPPPNVGDTLHSSEGSGDPNRDFDDDHSVVPVEMIKVEVEEEGGTNSNPLRGSEGSGVALGDGPTGEGDTPLRGRRNVKENLSNSFAEFGSSNHGGGEVEKEEEHDQIEAYNGSDQLAGPSGVQGTPQMMNWGEEDGNFPHNLFGGEDSSQQQVDGECLSPLQRMKAQLKVIDWRRANLSHNISRIQQAKSQFAEDVGFEGFEADQKKISEVRKIILDNQLNTANGVSDSETSSMDSEISFTEREPIHSPSSFQEFQEYTPFEVLAQQFEEELGMLPLEVRLEQENDTEYTPPDVNTNEKQKYFCYKCNALFKTKRKMDIHLHERRACVFSCPVCPFKGKEILKHIKFHSNVTVHGTLLCVICKERVSSMHNLLSHLERQHTF